MIQIITRTTLILLFYAATAPLSEASYDPLRVKENLEIVTFDLVIHDEKRNRDIPVFVYAPISKTPLPLVLFSHGLGGNRKGSAFLGKHWAVRGYIVAYIQHPGSDDSVWSNTPRLFRWFAMKEAASLDNFSLRVQDVPAVLDQLTLWNASDKSPLFGKIDLTRIGMCGHSFGALTTQAVRARSNCKCII
jgi:predicted dienelactone hydrolase